MAMDLTQVKHEIETLAEKHRDEFEVVSAYIFAHPELAFHEKEAQKTLCDLLERHGFQVHTMKRWRRISYAGCWKSMALKYSGEPALWRPHLWRNTGAENRE